MNNETKSALPTHSTEVDMTSAWDNGANKKRVKSPATKSYFSKIFAYLDNGADDTVKSSYRYIHHEVSADGTPGAANMRALAAGMAALNGARLGTVIDEAGRKGVHAHLASHYEDAGRTAPPLLGKSELDSIYTMMETKSTELTIGQTVAVDNVEEIVYGTIIESNNGEVAVREWNFTDEEWLPSDAVYDFPLEEVTADNFLFKSLESNVQEYNLDDAPSSEEAQGVDNVTTIKSKDYEMTEQDFEVLVKSIAKLVIAEVGVKVDPVMEPMMEPDDAATDQADVMGASLGLAPGLQALMGNIVPLYFASHRAHWNVQGTDFSEYHELFEEIYSDIYSSIDPLAENIRKIGAFPQSLMTMMMNAEVKDDTITTDARELAADLISKNLDVLELLKEVFKACDEMDEQGIANFIAERIDMHEKWNWQLSASIAAPGINAPKAAEEGEVKEDSEVETEIKSEAEDAPTEDAPVEDAAAAVEEEEEAVEEAAAECTNEEHTDGCCGAAEEKAAFLTLNDLKEFSDLLDML